MNNNPIKPEIINFIKRHWRKVAFGSILFLTIRILIFGIVAFWILSGVMSRRQEIQEVGEEFKSSFEEMSKAFEKDFKATRTFLENSQSHLKTEFDQKKSDFDKSFQEGREKLEKRFKNFGKF